MVSQTTSAVSSGSNKLQSSFKKHKMVWLIGGGGAAAYIWYSYSQASTDTGATDGEATDTATDTTVTEGTDYDTAAEEYGTNAYSYDPSLDYGYSPAYGANYGGGYYYDAGLPTTTDTSGNITIPSTIRVVLPKQKATTPKKTTAKKTAAKKKTAKKKTAPVHVANGYYRLPPARTIQVKNGKRYHVSARTWRRLNANRKKGHKIRPKIIGPRSPVLKLPYGGLI